MAQFKIPVYELYVKNIPLKIKEPTFIVDDKVVTIKEASGTKFRCSRLKFQDLDRGAVRLQSDGLKLVFCGDRASAETVSLFRAHVDEICRASSKEAKKHHTVSQFGSFNSPMQQRGAVSRSSHLRSIDRSPAGSHRKLYHQSDFDQQHDIIISRARTPFKPSPSKMNENHVLGSANRLNSNVSDDKLKLRRKKKEDAEWAKLFASGSNASSTKRPRLLSARDTQKDESPLAKVDKPVTRDIVPPSQYQTPPPSLNKAMKLFSRSPTRDGVSTKLQFENDGKQSKLFSSDNSVAACTRCFGGIKNLGNTCFIGGVLQALCCLDLFNLEILSPFWLSVCSRSKYFVPSANRTVIEFQNVLRALNEYRPEPVNIMALKDTVSTSLKKYSGYLQHDAHEFLRDLLTLVEDDLRKGLKELLSDNGECIDNLLSLNTKKKVVSFETPKAKAPEILSITVKNKIHSDRNASTKRIDSSFSDGVLQNLISTNLFSSTMGTSLTCLNCGEERLIEENYKDFALEIQFVESHDQSVLLQDMISKFFAADSRHLRCEACHHADARVNVQSSILEAPEVLCLQLKRFSFDSDSRQHSKITTKVSFPPFLNLKSYCSVRDVLERNTNSGNTSLKESVLVADFESFLGALSSNKLFEKDTDSLVSQNPVRLDPVPQNKFPWACEQCTYINKNSDDLCEVCNSPRFEDLSTLSSHQPAQQEDVTNHLDGDDLPFTYELVAVLRHVGPHAYAGHYTCDVKKVVSEKNCRVHRSWLHCDDSIVAAVSQNTVLSDQENPYILFYQRVKSSE